MRSSWWTARHRPPHRAPRGCGRADPRRRPTCRATSWRSPDGTCTAHRDPYTFLPTLGELDLHLVGEGRHELWERLGAHPARRWTARRGRLLGWAPSARSVSVVGDWNAWDGRVHPMRSLGSSGVWELFLPGVAAGAHYKYEIRGADGELRLKADPLATPRRCRRATASVVESRTSGATRRGWSAARGDARRRPMSIYEVHLGSWRLNPLEGNRPLTYRELADELGDYASDMGFTHVELLPVMAHPFSGSWGYQVTSYFAPPAALGTPGRPQGVRRPAARPRRRRAPRLGARALPARRLAWPASTAPRSTSTPTRAAARTPTGAP